VAQAKQASKRQRRKRAFPAVGAAAVSLALAGGASASTGGPATDVALRDNTALGHEIVLGEEEISGGTRGLAPQRANLDDWP
jgi:hypothetical protein